MSYAYTYELHVSGPLEGLAWRVCQMPLSRAARVPLNFGCVQTELMLIKIISGDPELCGMFREILTEFPREDWRLSTLGADDTVTAADLCVIDHQPGMQLPEGVDWSNSAYLLVIHRTELDKLTRTVAHRNPNVLLKPVTRAAVHSLMGFALSAYKDRLSATSDLRADR